MRVGEWEMGKRGPKPKTDIKEQVAAALVAAIPVLPAVDPASLRGHESTIERSGLTEMVCQLVFAGHSNVAIGKRLGIGTDTLDRFLHTPYFQAVYASKREMLLGLVDELSRERCQEILLQAIEKKYSIMVDPTTSRGLADKIATDFIQMGERMLKMGKGRTSDALAAIFEQTLKQRGKDGKETTATVRISGTVAEVAAASRGFQVSDVSGGSGEGARDDEAGGTGDGTVSTGEDEGRALAPWDRRGDSGSGVQPGGEATGESGGEPAPGGVREGGG